jgi:hypothetical protein
MPSNIRNAPTSLVKNSNAEESPVNKSTESFHALSILVIIGGAWNIELIVFVIGPSCIAPTNTSYKPFCAQFPALTNCLTAASLFHASEKSRPLCIPNNALPIIPRSPMKIKSLNATIKLPRLVGSSQISLNSCKASLSPINKRLIVLLMLPID